MLSLISAMELSIASSIAVENSYDSDEDACNKPDAQAKGMNQIP